MRGSTRDPEYPKMFDNMDLGSSKPLECTVVIDGSTFLLREPSEDAVAAYKRTTVRGASLTDRTLTGLHGAADGEPALVAACLFAVDVADGKFTNERSVSEKQVRAWVGRICAALFDRLKEMCPYVVGEPDTVESIDKQLNDLNGRKLRLLAGKDDGPKN